MAIDSISPTVLAPEPEASGIEKKNDQNNNNVSEDAIEVGSKHRMEKKLMENRYHLYGGVRAPRVVLAKMEDCELQRLTPVTSAPTDHVRLLRTVSYRDWLIYVLLAAMIFSASNSIPFIRVNATSMSTDGSSLSTADFGGRLRQHDEVIGGGSAAEKKALDNADENISVFGGLYCRQHSRPAICSLCSHGGGQDCLCLRQQRRVDRPAKSRPLGVLSAHKTRLSSDTRRRITALPGNRLDRRGLLAALPAITEMQWSMSVRGSIGQLGDAGIGKMTVLLAQMVDQDSGEQLFVVDPFNSSTRLTADSASGHRGVGRPGVSQFDQFAATVRQFDIDVVSSTEDKVKTAPVPTQTNVLYVHRGTSSDWSAIDRSLVAWNVPLFRLIILETRGEQTATFSDSATSPDPMSLRSRLDLAVCLIGNGGIIAIDVSDGLDFDFIGPGRGPTDAFTTRSRDRRRPAGVAESLVSGFLERHGTELIAPLVLIDSTLYLTTTNWRRRYADQLHDWLRQHHVLSTTSVRLELAYLFQSHVFHVVR